MSYPEVKVTEVTEQRDQIEGADTPNPIDLGGKFDFETSLREGVLAEAQRGIRAKQRRVFELEWEGSKIPRGANILGHPVGWTQHGFVTSQAGVTIGTYDRVIEFGGESGEQQKMFIYVSEDFEAQS
jgi:hypothetical protein